MSKVSTWLQWILHRPIALINLIGIVIIIFGIFGVVVYNATRSIEVLEGWSIALSNPKEVREVEGKKVGVYNPGHSLIFTSKSTKIENAEGTSVRTIVCEATSGQAAREIQLDRIPATRPTGVNPQRENAVTVPDVSQFAGLPRWCKLVIDITYVNVGGTGRTWQEHAETDRFLVEEARLDTQALLNKIDELETQILDLRSQLPVGESAQQQSTPVSPAPAPRASGAQPSSNTGGGNVTNNTTNVTPLPTPAKQSREVCDPVLDLLGIKIGAVNCRQEEI